MTVSGIGSVSQTLASASVDQSRQVRMSDTLGPVAQLFGMTTDQLQQALQSGQSLSDIASSKGVSPTDLLSAIKQGIQQAQPNGAPPLSDNQLTNIANRVANHHHHHHHGGGGSPSTVSPTTPTDPPQL
jgi:hypothetical protein